MTEILIGVAAVLAGLNAGLFAVFSYAVMPGLARVNDDSFVAAMRGINAAIVNPLFALIFFGGSVANLAAVVSLGTDEGATFALTVSLALQVATVAITMMANVPLNVGLDRAHDIGPAGARQRFEQPWTRWNHLRALTSTGALIAVVVAAIQL